MTVQLRCYFSGEHDWARMAALAERLRLPLCDARRDGEAGEGSYRLFLQGGRLCLQAERPRPPAPTCVDFLDPALAWRRATSGKSQGIARAVGLRRLRDPLVLDATAGLGRDAFILAALGCRVTLLERSPLLHALLEDGVRRAREAEDPELAAIVSRMALLHADARQWLAEVRIGARERPDIIYLDPMFPPRGGSARVKKDIGLLQEVLGPDEDIAELLDSARAAARHRVVVKRPGTRTRESGERPDFQVPGKAAHFDVYLARPAD